MILQALNDYYERLAQDNADFPRYGTNERNLDFVFVLTSEGNVSRIDHLKDDERSRRPMIVPYPSVQKEKKGYRLIPKRSSHIAPFFLWDKAKYVLGREGASICRREFEAFRELHHHIAGKIEHTGVKALLAFLDAWAPENADEILPEWKEVKVGNIVFRLVGNERSYLHEDSRLIEQWRMFVESIANPVKGVCMILQRLAPLSGSHPPIRNLFKVNSSQKAEGTMVGINVEAAPAFSSYNLGSMLSPPISESAAFNYTTALNDLLKPGSRQKVQIGDASTVFWTEKETESEGFLGLVFSQNESQGDLNDLRLFLEAARDGKMPDKLQNEGDIHFFVLGLSPNSSRLSVRFWHEDTVEGMWRKIGQHFDDLRIDKTYDNEPGFPSMHQLLRATLTLKDNKEYWETVAKNPRLPGEFMRSILTGAAYPRSLLSTVLGRIRAEQANKDKNGKPINNVNYFRAALIKACLVRNARLAGKTSEVTVSLDESSMNSAYRLGRLFAVLEKLQQEAIPGANSTIKDRYYGSASATPRSVFPILLRLAQHHVAKAEYGYASDNRIAQIMNGLEEFPAHLSLENQGMFALGYYHQRTSLWTKKAAAPETNTTTEQ